MKSTVIIYLVFCIILAYICWYYSKLNHAEKCKQTKLAEEYFSRENDNFIMIMELKQRVEKSHPAKKEVIKKSVSKKKKK